MDLRLDDVTQYCRYPDQACTCGMCPGEPESAKPVDTYREIRSQIEYWGKGGGSMVLSSREAKAILAALDALDEIGPTMRAHKTGFGTPPIMGLSIGGSLWTPKQRPAVADYLRIKGGGK